VYNNPPITTNFLKIKKNIIIKIKGPFMKVVLWKEKVKDLLLKPKFKNEICNDSIQIS